MLKLSFPATVLMSTALCVAATSCDDTSDDAALAECAALPSGADAVGLRGDVVSAVVTVPEGGIVTGALRITNTGAERVVGTAGAVWVAFVDPDDGTVRGPRALPLPAVGHQVDVPPGGERLVAFDRLAEDCAGSPLPPGEYELMTLTEFSTDGEHEALVRATAAVRITGG